MMQKTNSKHQKILFLTHVGEPGGAEFVMMRLCESVKDCCKVIHFEEGSLKRRLHDKGISNDIIPMPKSISGVRRQGGIKDALKAIPSVISMLSDLIKESKNYDVIICISQKSFILSAMAKPFVRKPLIWFMNDLVSPEHFSKPLIFLMTKVFAPFAKKIVLNSQASLEAWENSGGSVKKAVVIYPGTDETVIDDFLKQKEKIDAYRGQFSEEGKPLIGIFGRICDWKGQDIFLKAVAQIPDVKGVIVGEAFFDQKPFQEKLNDIVRNYGLERRVMFAGHIDDVSCAMAACDVIVHASTQPEPFGLVIVEAMMCKKPVIASNAGGAKEIIIDHECGLLTKSGDADALAKAIKFYLDNPEQAANIAACGRKRAVKKFSNTIMIQSFKMLLREI